MERGPASGPNPLRPYYIPPSIGERANLSASPSSSSSASPPARSASSLPTFDYSDIVSDTTSSLTETSKRWLHGALMGYAAAVLFQPFVVGTTILQLQVNRAPKVDPRAAGRRAGTRGAQHEEIDASDSDSDEPDYFTSTAPHSRSSDEEAAYRPSRRAASHPSRTHSHAASTASSAATTTAPSPYLLHGIRAGSMLDVLTSLQRSESFLGPWKATNTTFLYTLLSRFLDSWTASLLSSLLNVTDPASIDDLVDSPDAVTTLIVAVIAKVLTSVALAPLDIIRTRQMVSPSPWPRDRGVISAISELPGGWLCPAGILPITILSAAMPEAMAVGTPLFLRRRLGIDPVMSPTAYQTLRISLLAGRTFLALPFETVLRRGQMAESSHPAAKRALRRQKGELPELGVQADTVVEVGEYSGLFGTMWNIVNREGDRAAGHGAHRQGQGVEGLFRGWRVCAWSLAGGLVFGGLIGGAVPSGAVGREF